ncbi:hypothetical protein JDN40_02330 [Rhodomicrobium vannielii ATCC 17100]|uniref:hypothetical protein n=1 Tax=Rhodomicrobium vannielii TaxID=1069 RepID=UPI00191B47CB|nr:hypothetical protein [Rhodomicrobium vannielii]MBJ7532952.1 hypothetical protein [Rhodomicrobium vannielii ATCC 17100]
MPRPPQFPLLILTFFLFWLAGTQAAIAEKSPSCGDDAREAIAIAEKALAAKDPTMQGLALSCAIKALKLIEATQPIVRRGDGDHQLLHVPTMPKNSDGGEKR